jgi:hypothetical protein
MKEGRGTLLDLRGNIPSFIHISNGRLHDVHVLDLLIPETLQNNEFSPAEPPPP